MGKFEKNLLKQFVIGLNCAYVVFDPEFRLEQGTIKNKLKQKGFSIIEYNPTPNFRYIYEVEYRQMWDSGKKKELIVLIKDKRNLPIDFKDFFNYSAKFFWTLSYSFFYEIYINVFSKLFYPEFLNYFFRFLLRGCR